MPPSSDQTLVALANRPAAAPAPGFLAGLAAASVFTLYALLLRALDTADLLRAGAVSISPLGPPFSLPFLLGEELVVGALLGSFVGFCWRKPPLRALALAFFGAYLLLLAGDQLAFELVFSHIDYALYADTHDIGALRESIRALLDPSSFAAVGLALAATAFVASPRRPRALIRLARAVAARPRTAAAACAAYFLVTLAFACAADQHGLDRPFPLSFAASYLRARAEQRREERAQNAPRGESRFTATAMAGPAAPEDELSPVRRALESYRKAHGKGLNVVWYLMESTSLRDTSLASSAPYDTTPFLARLAGRSLLFSEYHTGVAASTRAFFSALTGLDPYMDPRSDLVKHSRIAAPTIVDIAHDAGYATAFFASSDAMFESLDALLGAQKYDAYMDKNLIPAASRPGVSTEAWGVDEEIVIDEALAWIAERRAAGEPYFVSYNAVYPHHPFNVPSPHRALYDMDWGEPLSRARFRASLRYADMSLERMYAGLERLDALGDTLFVVSPDHGEAFGDVHRKNFMHGEHCYEEDTHIFLLLHSPEALGPPLVSKRLGSHRDMLPTLLDLLGIDRALDIDGRSLFAPIPPAPELHCFSRRQLAMRRGDLKAILDRDDDRVALYDLAADPSEQSDLAPARPAEAASFADEIRAWKATRAADLRARAAASGLEDDEVAAIAQKRRREIYGGALVEFDDVAICPAAAADCFAQRSRRFPKGTGLAVLARLGRTVDAGLRVDVYAPDGKRIHTAIADFKGEEGAGGGIPGALFAAPGRYKIKVSVVQSYAVHAARILAIEITP